MSRRIITIIFIVGVIATFFLKPQSKSYEVLGMPNFTVITRTPSPEPPTPIPPTATDDDGDDGGGSNPPPQPTSVPPTNTPTIIPVTLVATPIGGFFPTAVACGLPPTIQANNKTRVRSGPGTNYGIITELVYLETKPIIGRAANAEWWIIQLTNDETGWVANAVVKVAGNTNGIPIVPSPAIDEKTPTPGPFWNPTPNPNCPTIPPTVTSTPTEMATSIPAPSATNTPISTETATQESSEEEAVVKAEDTVTPSSEESESTATATSVVPTAETTSVDVEAGSLPPTAESLDSEEAQNAVSALPCASAMIGLAVIGFLAFRRIF